MYLYTVFIHVLFKHSSKIWNARNNKRGCSIQHTATNLMSNLKNTTMKNANVENVENLKAAKRLFFVLVAVAITVGLIIQINAHGLSSL